jgi:hypothetical protein
MVQAIKGFLNNQRTTAFAPPATFMPQTPTSASASPCQHRGTPLRSAPTVANLRRTMYILAIPFLAAAFSHEYLGASVAHLSSSARTATSLRTLCFRCDIIQAVNLFSIYFVRDCVGCCVSRNRCFSCVRLASNRSSLLHHRTGGERDSPAASMFKVSVVWAPSRRRAVRRMRQGKMSPSPVDSWIQQTFQPISMAGLITWEQRYALYRLPYSKGLGKALYTACVTV